jgi:ligand-binding sensor domain-containing protein
MTRAVMIDKDKALWFGTDNGIVKLENQKMEVYNCKNTPLKSPGLFDKLCQLIKFVMLSEADIGSAGEHPMKE